MVTQKDGEYYQQFLTMPEGETFVGIYFAEGVGLDGAGMVEVQGVAELVDEVMEEAAPVEGEGEPMGEEELECTDNIEETVDALMDEGVVEPTADLPEDRPLGSFVDAGPDLGRASGSMVRILAVESCHFDFVRVEGEAPPPYSIHDELSTGTGENYLEEISGGEEEGAVGGEEEGAVGGADLGLFGEPISSSEDSVSSDSDNISITAVVGERRPNAVAAVVPDNGFNVSTADEKHAFNRADNELKKAVGRLGSALTLADVVECYNKCSFLEVAMNLRSARAALSSETDDLAYEILQSNRDWARERARWSLDNPTARRPPRRERSEGDRIRIQEIIELRRNGIGRVRSNFHGK